VEETTRYNGVSDITTKQIVEKRFGRNTQIGSTSYTNLEIARPYPRQSFCVGDDDTPFTGKIDVKVPLVNSQINFDYLENAKNLKGKVSFAKQVRDIGDLSFNWNIGNDDYYYSTEIDLTGYTLPKGSETEEVTLYVTYKDADNREKTAEQTFVLNDCSVGGTPAPSGSGGSTGNNDDSDEGGP
jgi:hypothetical protein